MNILIAGLLMKIEEDHLKILNLSCVILVGEYFCTIRLGQNFFLTKPTFLHSPKIPVFKIKPFVDALKHLALEILSAWNFQWTKGRPLVFSLNPTFSVA